MPVVRNPQFYFREGFCWTNILNPQARLLKAKMKSKSVNDVGSMSLCSIVPCLPNYYLVALLNSELMFDYYREFINCTVNIQINDIRQLPVYIPSQEQLASIKPLVDRAVSLKRSIFCDNIKDADVESEMSIIERDLNSIIEDLYYSI